MRYQEKVYVHVWAEWRQTLWNGAAERFYTERNHHTDCTVIDSSPSQATILFPEGDKIRRRKSAAGFRINGTDAMSFLRNPSKHCPVGAAKTPP